MDQFRSFVECKLQTMGDKILMFSACFREILENSKQAFYVRELRILRSQYAYLLKDYRKKLRKEYSPPFVLEDKPVQVTYGDVPYFLESREVQTGHWTSDQQQQDQVTRDIDELLQGD